ncbi:J domain-containing protein [Arthrobacter sp. CAU 1506]|uniref:J domain-containing protein n=1 Tax=Arthrobacter sp. CAU 1506 TaxID=2560052 RepID=UPI00145C5329|nr:J domain-containing protein [Arthrobacter sp. CAU 1506]
MNETDLYAVLQVAPDASNDDIRRAYRALVRSHHPDLKPDGGGSAPGDESAPGVAEPQTEARTTAAILHAYMVLGDAGRRAEYDRTSSRRVTVRHHQQPAEAGAAEPGDVGASEPGESRAGEAGVRAPASSDRPQRRPDRSPAVPVGRPVYLGFGEPLPPDAVRLGESPSSSSRHYRRWIVFDR